MTSAIYWICVPEANEGSYRLRESRGQLQRQESPWEESENRAADAPRKGNQDAVGAGLTDRRLWAFSRSFPNNFATFSRRCIEKTVFSSREGNWLRTTILSIPSGAVSSRGCWHTTSQSKYNEPGGEAGLLSRWIADEAVILDSGRQR